MLLKKLSIVIACVWTMTGCESLTKRYEPPIIPANLKTPCADLAEVSDGQAATLLRWGVVTTKAYAVCKSRHAALVDAWPTK